MSRQAAIEPSVAWRADELFEAAQHSSHVRTDRMMLVILFAQWLVAIALAWIVSPYTWAGRVATIHAHVKLALGLGAIVNALPAFLVWARPGAAITRQVVAIAQMLWSAILIHLTTGRIETHFHVFVSLAFLAFYRDWRVLPTASVVVCADHLIRELLVPESVYGTVDPEWWRFVEHAAWVAFEDAVLILGCLRKAADLRRVATREAELEALNRSIESKVGERTAELDAERRRYQSLVEETNVIPWEYDTSAGKMSYVGPQIGFLGYPVDAWCTAGFWQKTIHADDRERYRAQLARAIADQADCALEYRLIASDGRHVHVRDVVSTRTRDGGQRRVRGIVVDVSELRRLQSELAQAQKLEAVGQLAAGIAHEINTPVQFASDSVYFARIVRAEIVEALRAAPRPGLDGKLESLGESLELAGEGLARVTSIVKSMRVFGHPDGDEGDTDLNEGLRSTLIIAAHEYRYIADVETDLGDLPTLRCRAGELNQVFLNLIVNSAHAIAEKLAGSDRRGTLAVRSRFEDESIVISVSDDGAGIPETIRHRVFEQFFTTKPVGKGTGQGLAISRAVVERHGGKLSFVSEPGQGTTFTIRLPLGGAGALAA